MRQLQQESPVVAEHAGAGDGSLQGRMATAVQQIDRDAAKRVAGVLAVDEGEDAEPTAELVPIGPKPAVRGAWVPRILAACTLVGVANAAMQLSRKPEHASSADGSLGQADGVRRSRAVAPTEVPSMNNPIQRLSMVTSLAGAVAATASAQQVMEWRHADGGNGHWYQVRTVPGEGEPRVTWDAARALAQGLGGHLVTINSPEENAFLFASLSPEMVNQWSCWIGAYRSGAGEWNWVTAEEFSCGALPSGRSCPFDCCEDRLYTGSFGDGPYLWVDDHDNDFQGGKRQYLVEWSADCNGDGLVDFGQIAQGQLADMNTNGIPDTCDCSANPGLPICCPCDVFRDSAVNGIDLGVLLGQWGAVTQYTVTDFNGDGAVDGLDLGTLLAAWGPCAG